MASIDKTYVDNYEDYLSYYEWAKDKYIEFFNKKRVYLRDYIYKWNESDFIGDGDLPMMNTPTYVDIYLIQNCPINFVQERLRYVYGREYKKLKSIKFPIDMPMDYKTNSKVVIRNFDNNTYYPLFNKGINSHQRWIVEILGEWWYNEDWNTFVNTDLHMPFTSNVMCVRNIKSLVRKLRKMYLPKGLELILRGRYVGETYKIIIK